MKKSEYELSPKTCLKCGKILQFEQRRNKFCSHSCSANIKHLFEYRKHKPNTCEQQSKAGKQCKIGENKKAEELKSQYDSMFLPQSICDRICFKNGKIIFIEIKQKKGIRNKLSEKQKEFKELCEKYGYKYMIEYID